MDIGQEYRVKFPFIVSSYTGHDSDGGVYCEETWVPGVKSKPVPPDDCEAVADAEGEMILTIVDIHKPGRFPKRVFYTRKWIDPDGKGFGKTKLHITTVPTFIKRAAGYYHEYRVL